MAPPAPANPAPLPHASVEVDIRPAQPPVELPSDWDGALGLAWLLALVALAYYAWRRWLRPRPTPAPADSEPPHTRAREQLRAALALLGRPEPFCVRISQVLRVYLEERLDLRAPERATEEFIEELRASALLDLPHKQRLAEFLERCDLVKFARYEPGEPELRDLYDAAVQLVDATTPQFPTAAAAPRSPTAAAAPASS